MGKKKRDTDSSLELLLDTMCNTFGGVMFIAIALVVIMSMLSGAGQVRNTLDSKKLQQELEKLQQEINQAAQKNEQLEKIISDMESDPRNKLLADVLKMEAQNEQNQIQITLLEQNLKLTDDERKREEKEINILEKQIKTAGREKTDLEQKQEELAEQIRKNKREKINSSRVISFRIMEESTKMPYYLIVWQNSVWKVGPERMDQTAPLLPNPEFVTSSSAQTPSGDTQFQCTPVPGKGIPILDGKGRISPELLRLLNELPRDRVPLFSIDRDSITNFWTLREYLKQQKLLHGVNTEFDAQKMLVYSITQKEVRYEY